MGPTGRLPFIRPGGAAASDHAQSVASAGTPSTLLGAAGLQLGRKVPDRSSRAVVASVPDAFPFNFRRILFPPTGMLA